MPSVLYYDSFSRAYNHWLDDAADIRKEFEDSPEFTRVLDIVCGLLNRGLTLDSNAAGHPFNRYADADKTGLENFHTLATDTMAAIQDSYTRGYAHAFFHSGGANYADMLELLDSYLLFADRAEDPDWSGPEDDTDTDADTSSEADDESVIDLTGDEEPYFDAGAPPQHPISSPNEV